MPSEHRITVRWERTTVDFDTRTFDRNHVIEYDGGEHVRASTGPDYGGDPACVDPEQGIVGALASCHMLTFLTVAAIRKLVVDRYEDAAYAEVGKNADGKMMVSRMVLRPRVVFGGPVQPDAATVAALHEKAHANCFIANSVRSEVLIEPQF